MDRVNILGIVLMALGAFSVFLGVTGRYTTFGIGGGGQAAPNPNIGVGKPGGGNNIPGVENGPGPAGSPPIPGQNPVPALPIPPGVLP